MKILLATPINRSYVVMPSLGIGYLAAVARNAGHHVSVLNCQKESMTFKRFEQFIADNHFDLIGFQIFSYDLNPLKRHLEIIKQVRPETILIGGGAHPSSDPFGTMAYLPLLDYAFKGEAETGFPLLLARLQSSGPPLHDIPGLVFRDEVTIKVNSPGHVIDLDSLPLPAWEILEPETYPEAPHGAFTRQFPTAPVMFTRGCPGRCTFCAGRSITGNIIRKRSLENIMSELRLLKSRGIREFHIEDENFTAHRQLVMEFCQRLQQENVQMSWSLPSGVRLDGLDREMLETMAAAGCYSLALGIEFGTQRILDLTRKNLSLAMVREKLSLFKGLGIKTTGFFLLNIPGETLEEMRETIEFSLELPLDRAQYNNFMPLPGSNLWTQLQQEGMLNNLNWDSFFVHDVAYCQDGIKPADIKKLQRTAYLRFYLRPRIILGLIAEIRSWRQLTYLLRRFVDALT